VGFVGGDATTKGGIVEGGAIGDEVTNKGGPVGGMAIIRSRIVRVFYSIVWWDFASRCPSMLVEMSLDAS